MRLAFLSILSVLAGGLATSTTAQTWARTGVEEDAWRWGWTAVEAADGGFFAVGMRQSSLENAAWIAHVTAEGTFGWQRHFDGVGRDEFRWIGRTTSGDIVVAGHTTTHSVDGIRDVWIVRLSPAGEVRWELIRRHEGNIEQPLGVDPTLDDGVAIAFVGGSVDWAVELDALGDVVWQRTYEGRPRRFQQVADGTFAAAGGTIGGEVWSARVDGNGEILWSHGIEHPEPDVTTMWQRCAAASPDGSTVQAGYYFTDADPQRRAFVAKVTPMGSLEWGVEVNRDGFSHVVADCQVLDDGGVVVAGTDQITDMIGEIRDPWWIRLDADGDLVWQRSLVRSVHEDASSITPLRDGGFFVFGDSVGSGALMLRTDAEGRVEPPCPGFVDAQFTITPLALVVSDRPVENEVATSMFERVETPSFESTATVSEICCPFVDRPTELSGIGTSRYLHFPREIEIEWAPPEESGGCWTDFYRGNLSELHAGIPPTCMRRTDRTSLSSGGDPGAGNAWYWVVRAVNLVAEGPIGYDTFGVERGLPAMPCP